MQVVIVEPKKKPMVKNIDDGLEAMQKIVGGTIQAIYPFEEPIALICNDEGKFLNLPLNRALRDSTGCVYDIVAGTFFLCAAPTDKDNFALPFRSNSFRWGTPCLSFRLRKVYR